MDEDVTKRLYDRALCAVKKFLQAKDDFEKVQNRPASDRVAVATAGRFVEAHEEMRAAVDALEAYRESLLPTNGD